jgi:hypothetical protein
MTNKEMEMLATGLARALKATVLPRLKALEDRIGKSAEAPAIVPPGIRRSPPASRPAIVRLTAKDYTASVPYARKPGVVYIYGGPRRPGVVYFDDKVGPSSARKKGVVYLR